MRSNGPNLLRWISISMLLAAVGLMFVELVIYSQQRARMPYGLAVGGVPIGGLSQTAAAERLAQTYNRPVELHYDDQIILLDPSSVGFQLDNEAMLAAAEEQRTDDEFWSGFWDFLWNRPGEAENVPIRAEYSQAQLEAALQDIAARYDEPPETARPVPGTTRFESGEPGRVLDISRAAELVGEVLTRPQNRRVNLPVVASEASRPSLGTLETLLKQIAEVREFDGLADLYLMDLRTGEELHMVTLNGEEIQADPGVAITAGSTIKIPIGITYFRYHDLPLDQEVKGWIEDMITLSGNETSDLIMEEIDTFRGPLLVTETMQELGLENTFIAGYFRLGAELLRVYQTPSNTRDDIDTDPDPYTQTTASEMGWLLADLYRCAEGGGTIRVVYDEEVTQEECSYLLDLLAQNNIAVLLEAGVPEGTRVAHKHGWTGSPLEWLGDAGIIYTPGGDYVLSVYLWDQEAMIWEPTSALVADISEAVYNYFNPPAETTQVNTR
ncbi:MAG: serine hydrolase [Anaerolineales bacterium]